MQDLRYLCSWPLSAASVTAVSLDSETLGSEDLISLSLWNSGHQGNGFSSLALLSFCQLSWGSLLLLLLPALGFFFFFICLLLGMTVGTVRMTQDACLYQQQHLVVGTPMVPQEWASSLIVGGTRLESMVSL